MHFLSHVTSWFYKVTETKMLRALTSSKKAPHFGRDVLFPEHNFAMEIYVPSFLVFHTKATDKMVTSNIIVTSNESIALNG